MAFIGAKPTNVPLTANDITDGSISVAKLTSALDLSSNTVTLPSGVGGKILQIKSLSNNTLNQASTNSETFADVSDLDLVITPTSSSSKFVLFVSTHTDTGGDGHGLTTRLTYNHSGISQTELDDNYDSYGYHARADRTNTWQSMNYYLAPNTTNEITFRLQIATVTAGETSYFNRKAYRCIAMEYA